VSTGQESARANPHAAKRRCCATWMRVASSRQNAPTCWYSATCNAQDQQAGDCQNGPSMIRSASNHRGATANQWPSRRALALPWRQRRLAFPAVRSAALRAHVCLPRYRNKPAVAVELSLFRFLASFGQVEKDSLGRRGSHRPGLRQAVRLGSRAFAATRERCYGIEVRQRHSVGCRAHGPGRRLELPQAANIFRLGDGEVERVCVSTRLLVGGGAHLQRRGKFSPSFAGGSRALSNSRSSIP